jgi:tetratricopeptide (TPR) repeat protein
MAYCRSAQALLAKGNLTDAIKEAKQAFLYSPTYPEYRRMYATTVAKDATQLYEKGQTGKARLAYEFAFQIDPLNPETMADYGWLLYTGREQPYSVDDPGARAIELYTKYEGIYFLEQATKLAPNEPQYMVRMGQVYEQEGQWQSALEWYQRAVKVGPSSLEARLGAARCYNHMGAHESAVAVLKEGLTTAAGTELAAVYAELAAAYRGGNATGRAVEAAKSALTADADSARAHLELGLALRAQGAMKPALQEFKRADVLDADGQIGLQARVQLLQLRSEERVAGRQAG